MKQNAFVAQEQEGDDGFDLIQQLGYELEEERNRVAHHRNDGKQNIKADAVA